MKVGRGEDGDIMEGGEEEKTTEGKVVFQSPLEIGSTTGRLAPVSKSGIVNVQFPLKTEPGLFGIVLFLFVIANIKLFSFSPFPS